MKRIAINIGSGFLPGLDAVVTGAALAAQTAGCELVGIRDGYDGLLVPEHYPDGGLVTLSPALADGPGRLVSVLGTAARNDPFHVRTVSEDGAVEEVDRSDAMLKALDRAGIEAVISVVGGSAITGLHALSVAFKRGPARSLHASEPQAFRPTRYDFYVLFANRAECGAIKAIAHRLQTRKCCGIGNVPILRLARALGDSADPNDRCERAVGARRHTV